MEKDLAVNVRCDLKFRNHVNIQTEKANKLLVMIQKNFVALDTVLLPMLYKSTVPPNLKYGNIVWHPKFTGNKENLEQMLHRATKMIPQLAGKSHSDRLRVLKTSTLYYRRARDDMVECY